MRIFKVDLGSLYTFDLRYFRDAAPKLCKRYDTLKRLGLLKEMQDPLTLSADLEEFIEYWSQIGSGSLVRGLVITSEQLVELMTSGEEVSIKQEVPLGSVSLDINEALSKFTLLCDKLEGRLEHMTKPDGYQYNERVNVHMPGQALSTYNQVQLLLDCCSDGLQDSLDEGWRIIAACPQPDQRRPDYILGRFNPNHNLLKGADRG